MGFPGMANWPPSELFEVTPGVGWCRLGGPVRFQRRLTGAMERVTTDKPEYQADRSEQPIEYQRQDKLRDSPADRERQYHPSHENRPNKLRPGKAQRADGQSQGRQGDR